MVTEFLEYSMNTILFQRGIYDPEKFSFVTKYGLRLQVTNDVELTEYLKTVLSQLQGWLEEGNVKKLVLVISSVESDEVMERWVFDVQTDTKVLNTGEVGDKSEKDIQKEIAAILRQITSSVTFLPLLECACSFDLLIYTNNETETPMEWEESDPRYIASSNQVRLRQFTTSVHKLETSVAYRVDDALVNNPMSAA